MYVPFENPFFHFLAIRLFALHVCVIKRKLGFEYRTRYLIQPFERTFVDFDN